MRRWVIAGAISALLLAGLVVRTLDQAKSLELDTGPERASDRAKMRRPLAGSAHPEGPWAVLGQPGLPATRVAGMVVYRGAPVEGALLELTTTYQVHGGVTSDRFGHFDFGDVPPARIALAASAPGRSSVSTTLDLRAPAARDSARSLVVELFDCSVELQGRIQDVSGGDIAGASVAAVGGASTRSDTDGSYALCVHDEAGTLVVAAQNYATKLVGFGAGERDYRSVRLTPEASLDGVVRRSDDGSPVAGAVITASQSMPEVFWLTAVSDASGRFRFRGLKPGRYSVEGAAPGLLTTKQARVEVDVERAASVELRLAAAGRIEGRVEAPSGAPVSGARVLALGADVDAFSARTQKDGRFVIELPVGACSLSVSSYQLASGEEREEVEVTSTPTEVVVRVIEMARVTGVLLDGAEPVRNAVVTVRGTSATGRSSAWTRSDGSFEIDGLAGGAYLVSAKARGRLARAEINLATGSREVVELRLADGAAISGQVSGADGSPVSGATVFAVRSDRADVGTDQTDDAGRFRVGGLAGGAYRLVVRPNPMLPLELPTRAREPVEITLPHREASITGVEITVDHRTRRISGTVQRPDGQPVRDARIELELEQTFPPFMKLATTDIDGAFALPPMPRVPVKVRAVGYRSTSSVVRVEPDATSVTFVVPYPE